MIGTAAQRCRGSTSRWIATPASTASRKRSNVNHQSHCSSATGPVLSCGAANRASMTKTVLASPSHSASGISNTQATCQGPMGRGGRADAAVSVFTEALGHEVGRDT